MAAVMLLPTCAAYQLAGARPVMHAMAPMASRTMVPVMNSEEAGVRAGLRHRHGAVRGAFSLGNLITGSGLALLLYSVIAFLLNNGESACSRLLALCTASRRRWAVHSSAELPPVPG